MYRILIIAIAEMNFSLFCRIVVVSQTCIFALSCFGFYPNNNIICYNPNNENHILLHYRHSCKIYITSNYDQYNELKEKHYLRNKPR